MEINTPALSAALARDLYARMLLTRIVDEYACRLHEEAGYGFFTTCRGHEAAQIGSAVCIEVGKDFTLPYYRDLGVVLTIGMTPYEVFRSYTQLVASYAIQNEYAPVKNRQPVLHWGYHKHNIVTGPAPVATQVLHAAGIAFACKLRKAAVVTIAYCGDGATTEPDFWEGITFAAQHQLPVVFVYEQDDSSLLETMPLPASLEYICVDGTDVVGVYSSMQVAMQYAREGHGPVLVEMRVRRFGNDELSEDGESWDDPLLCCQGYLEERGMWDEEWVVQLKERLKNEVERAMEDALRDAL